MPPSEGEPDRLISDTLVYFVGRAIPAVLTIVSVPLFVRALGPEAYGVYALFSALALTIGSTFGGGIGQALLRYSTRIASWGGGELDWATRRATLVCVLGAALSTAIGSLFLPGSVSIAASAVAVAGSMVAYAVMSTWSQAELKARRSIVADVVRVVVTLGVPAVFVFGLGWKDPALLLVGVAVGNCVGLATLPKRRPTATGATRKASAVLGRMVSFGTPIAAWTLVAALLNVSDRYVIEVFLGSSAVGSYSAVYDLVYKGIVFLSLPLLLAAHPLIMDSWNRNDRIGAATVIRRTLQYSVVGGAVFTWIVWRYAPFVLPIVLGHEVSPLAARAAGPIAAGAFLWQAAMIVHKPLELLNRTNSMFIAVMISLIINVFINIAFIDQFGILCAAYSTLIGAMVYLFIICIMLFNTKNSFT